MNFAASSSRVALLLMLGCLRYATAAGDSSDDLEPREPLQDLEKRMYDFGLGKRAYRYSNEFKRLPMYDFGLGKRSKMYSFGLGKRADGEAQYDNFDEEEDMPEIEVYDDDHLQTADKRASKMYSFGLGKRPLYEFGLGKRAPMQYSFGLGKREKLYSFGLGKRGNKMYSFGLGKREVDLEEADSENSTAPMDSHEEMGHGQGRDVEKRSPRQYSFGLGKRTLDETEFHRQFRKPAAYSFGLGKRGKNLYQFGLGKRSAPA